MPRQYHPTPEERDERVKLPLDPETAIEGFLAVQPDRAEDSAPASEGDEST
jgi:hypothetical protein